MGGSRGVRSRQAGARGRRTERSLSKGDFAQAGAGVELSHAAMVAGHTQEGDLRDGAGAKREAGIIVANADGLGRRGMDALTPGAREPFGEGLPRRRSTSLKAVLARCGGRVRMRAWVEHCGIGPVTMSVECGGAGGAMRLCTEARPSGSEKMPGFARPYSPASGSMSRTGMRLQERLEQREEAASTGVVLRIQDRVRRSYLKWSPIFLAELTRSCKPEQPAFHCLLIQVKKTVRPSCDGRHAPDYSSLTNAAIARTCANLNGNSHLSKSYLRYSWISELNE